MSTGLRYLPALDGLRALALVGVLAFHSELDLAGGGFLGVSLFFTLSGFLITRLLLAERTASGGIDLARFWSRRARRLLPAAYAGIALALAVGLVIGDATSAATLRGDALATVGYAANWRFVIDGRSYAELFAVPSPLLHMWSLAIEEQLYLVIPLIVAVLARRGTRTLATGVLVLTAASVVAGAVLADGDLDRAYYGTDVRAVELLAGVLLAVVLHARPVQPPQVVRRLVGPAALAALAASWIVVDQADPGLYRGGLLAHAMVTCLVLWSIQAPGPLASALSVPPLRWLGTRSYGAYLYHWPIFLLMTEDRVGIEGPLLHALRISVVLVLTEVSYRLLEQPIRTGRVLSAPRARLSMAATACVLAVGAFLVPGLADPAPVDFASAQEHLDDAVALPPAPTAPSEQPRPRVAIYGDSTALLTGTGLTRWAQETGRWQPIAGVTSPGCPLVPGGSRRLGDQVLDVADGCAPSVAWPDRLAETDPDAVVIQAGNFDLLPWRPPGADRYLEPADPEATAAIRSSLAAANELLLTKAERVVWLTSPRLVDADQAEVARYELWNRLVTEVAAERPDDVVVVDLAGYLESTPGRLDDDELRPDRTHFTEESSYALARDWLGDAVASAITGEAA